MKLIDYLMMFRDDPDFDCPDTEIDEVVTVCFDKESVSKHMKGEDLDKEFPYFDLFEVELYKKVDVAYLLNDGSPVCDFSKLIMDNKDKFLNYAKRWWIPEYYTYVKDDDTELCYQFIKEFHSLVGGNYDETNNKRYYNLLKRCKA